METDYGMKNSTLLTMWLESDRKAISFGDSCSGVSYSCGNWTDHLSTTLLVSQNGSEIQDILQVTRRSKV